MEYIDSHAAQLRDRRIPWSLVMHICVSKPTIIGSDSGHYPVTIIWPNDGILLVGTLGTNVNEILIEI